MSVAAEPGTNQGIRAGSRGMRFFALAGVIAAIHLAALAILLSTEYGPFAITLSLLAYSGALAGLGLRYYAGLAAAFGFALYQQELMRERTRDGCFRAFLNNNWFGAAVFAGLLLNYY